MMEELLALMREHGVTSIHDTLGIEVVEANATRVVLSLEVSERVHQFTRILHGGVSVVLAESAASLGAAFNTDLSRLIPVGVEINANHLRSISKGTIQAIATPAHIGRQMMVWNVEIQDQRQRLICVARCTLMLRAGNAAKIIQER
ncbi:MAG: hotdog fold thioesterase [Acidobacteriota bacterium]